MSPVLNLRDSDSKFRQLIQSLCSTDEACEVKNDRGQTVAVLLPEERYASYQTYMRQKAENFAVFDRVAEAFKDVDELSAKIDQAVAERGQNGTTR